MTTPKTLLELSGADLNPPKLEDACLILIDIQNEYLDGPLELPNAETAIAQANKVLTAARSAGGDIIHIAHKGREGGLFDRNAERGKIVKELTPLDTELVIEKGLPNAFAGTELNAELEKTEKKNLIIIGFMSHMCVSSTARAALDLGYRVIVEAEACATRSLPDGKGGAHDANIIHDIAMVELSDRFAVVTYGHDWQ